MHQGPVRVPLRAATRPRGNPGWGPGLSGPRADVTGIVLAGGRSTRFGRDKLAEPYWGRPLLHHVASGLAEVCADVVVVLAPDAPEPALPAGLPVRFARDPVEGEGPLAGLQAGLLAAHTELALVAGGDMPDLQPEVLHLMLEAVAEDVDAVVLGEGESPRPLPCVVRSGRALDTAHALLHAGRRSLHELLGAMRARVVDERTWLALDPGRRTLHDVDEPGDLG